RPDDIIPLAHYLLARHAARDYQLTGRSTLPRLTADAAQLLRRYRWPGNVRELDNVMQRALILSASDEIGVHDILLEPEQCQTAMMPSLSESYPAASHAEQDALSAALPEAGLDPAISATSAATLDGDLRLQEANLILQALHACDGRRLETAERLGISPRTLRYKLARMRDSGIAIPQ
ncbi:MAG: helix-turn-helix domain-containing protein, partial [Plesiomonas shigelloides]